VPSPQYTTSSSSARGPPASCTLRRPFTSCRNLPRRYAFLRAQQETYAHASAPSMLQVCGVQGQGLHILMTNQREGASTLHCGWCRTQAICQAETVPQYSCAFERHTPWVFAQHQSKCRPLCPLLLLTCQHDQSSTPACSHTGLKCFEPLPLLTAWRADSSYQPGCVTNDLQCLHSTAAQKG
jgi:hypothetical protein